MNVALIIKGIHAWDVDRMIAANHDGQGTGLQDCAHAGFDIGV